MKRLKRISVLCLGLMLGLASLCVAQVKDDAKEIMIKAGFDCPVGKAAIEQGLLKESGVKTAVASLETKIVTITYDGTVTNRDKLIAAIEKCGYRTEFTPEDKEIKHVCPHDAPSFLPQKTE